jgi:hypothetical protein
MPEGKALSVCPSFRIYIFISEIIDRIEINSTLIWINNFIPVKVKLSVCLTAYHAVMTYWGSGGVDRAILTSALHGGEWSASRFDRFTPGERTHGTY